MVNVVTRRRDSDSKLSCKGESLELQRFTEAVMKESNEIIRVILCCLKCATTIHAMNMITPAFKIPKSFDDTWTVGSQFPWFGERVTGGVSKVESTTVEFNNGQPILFD